MSISNPIDETKSYVCKITFAKMVLNQDRITYACCFPEQDVRICCVVQNVHKHYGIEGSICVGYARAIKPLNWYPRFWPNKHLDADNRHVRSLACDEEIEHPIPAADVEDSRCGRNKIDQMITQDSYSTSGL